jgi:hypothetical protein
LKEKSCFLHSTAYLVKKNSLLVRKSARQSVRSNTKIKISACVLKRFLWPCVIQFRAPFPEIDPRRSPLCFYLICKSPAVLKGPVTEIAARQAPFALASKSTLWKRSIPLSHVRPKLLTESYHSWSAREEIPLKGLCFGNTHKIRHHCLRSE